MKVISLEPKKEGKIGVQRLKSNSKPRINPTTMFLPKIIALSCFSFSRVIFLKGTYKL
jgi:hypothetical protein